ncbi:trafficking protein particle complex subunit 14-like isoform X2 [Pelmatolapia mariae]|uniref:trafficking protein particle complex subunit 14-like isoform X2 n=1 Tax=Pelmatolapia mariae TaxID=158779 RepID=UPI002FE6943F
MESQYKFFMYFPVAQISSLSDAANYTTLPQRKNVYLGETLQFLLVLRSRGLTDRDDGALSWKDLGGSLCALASVCAAESWRQTPAEQCDRMSSCSEDSEDVESEDVECRTAEQSGRRLGDKQTFTQCNQLVSHKCSPSSAAMHNETEQAKSAWVLEDQLIFCLTVSLDKLPVSTRKAKGLEVPLLAVLQWHSPVHPAMRCISTCYSIPSVHLNRPELVMMASCPRTVRPQQHFWVKYTLLNNLQDFLAVRLIWNSEGGSQQDPSVGAVVCQSPLNNLGQCKKGSILSFTVAFQILKTGIFELSQHMTFTASVPAPPTEPQSPLKNTFGGHLSRLKSFPHHQPFWSGAMAELQTTTSPAGTVNRAPHLSPDPSFVSLVKIAKRECKVLVLE